MAWGRAIRTVMHNEKLENQSCNMPRVNKRKARELVRCKDLTTKHFPHGLQTVELSCRYEADWCLKCTACDLGHPSKPREPSMTSKAKLKMKAPKKRLRLLVGASPTKVVCPTGAYFWNTNLFKRTTSWTQIDDLAYAELQYSHDNIASHGK